MKESFLGRYFALGYSITHGASDLVSRFFGFSGLFSHPRAYWFTDRLIMRDFDDEYLEIVRTESSRIQVSYTITLALCFDVGLMSVNFPVRKLLEF